MTAPEPPQHRPAVVTLLWDPAVIHDIWGVAEIVENRNRHSAYLPYAHPFGPESARLEESSRHSITEFGP